MFVYCVLIGKSKSDLFPKKLFPIPILNSTKVVIIINTKQNKKLLVRNKLNFLFWHKNSVPKGFKFDFIHNGCTEFKLHFLGKDIKD